MGTFKPMLAAAVDDATKLQFPLLASAKLDGIRALVLNGVLVSRSLKPIPNRHVQAVYGRQEFEGFDGELIMGDPTAPDAFRHTSSAVMAHDGAPNVAFHVFDLVHQGADPFSRRLFALHHALHKLKPKADIFVVEQVEVKDLAQLDAFEAELLEAGHEGVMLRSSAGLYKHGRSTFKEHGLMKLKRFADAEAKIVGFEEQQHNSNDAVINELGVKARSTKQVGMVGKGTLGALMVVGLNGPYKGVKFCIGTGFDAAQRALIWREQFAWQGAVVKYKYFPLGSKDAPRFPVFLGVRDQADM